MGSKPLNFLADASVSSCFSAVESSQLPFTGLSRPTPLRRRGDKPKAHCKGSSCLKVPLVGIVFQLHDLTDLMLHLVSPRFTWVTISGINRSLSALGDPLRRTLTIAVLRTNCFGPRRGPSIDTNSSNGKSRSSV